MAFTSVMVVGLRESAFFRGHSPIFATIFSLPKTTPRLLRRLRSFQMRQRWLQKMIWVAATVWGRMDFRLIVRHREQRIGLEFIRSHTKLRSRPNHGGDFGDMLPWSNKSLQATRDGRSSSASRLTSFGPACLSSGRSAACKPCDDSGAVLSDLA